MRTIPSQAQLIHINRYVNRPSSLVIVCQLRCPRYGPLPRRTLNPLNGSSSVSNALTLSVTEILRSESPNVVHLLSVIQSRVVPTTTRWSHSKPNLKFIRFLSPLLLNWLRVRLLSNVLRHLWAGLEKVTNFLEKIKKWTIFEALSPQALQ